VWGVTVACMGLFRGFAGAGRVLVGVEGGPRAASRGARAGAEAAGGGARARAGRRGAAAPPRTSSCSSRPVENMSARTRMRLGLGGEGGRAGFHGARQPLRAGPALEPCPAPTPGARGAARDLRRPPAAQGPAPPVGLPRSHCARAKRRRGEGRGEECVFVARDVPHRVTGRTPQPSARVQLRPWSIAPVAAHGLAPRARRSPLESWSPILARCPLG
jgi:hypothetical protein